jgi:hypothetical protein
MTPPFKTEGVAGRCRARCSMTEPYLDEGAYRWYYCHSVWLHAASHGLAEITLLKNSTRCSRLKLAADSA